MRIRKNICLFLSLLLLVSQSGLSFNIHYCGNNIASVTLGIEHISHASAEKNCCSANPKPDNKKCCSNKSFSQKAHSDIIKVATGSYQAAIPVGEISVLQANFDPIPELIPQNETVHSDAHSPPLYELYCRLVFYA